MIHNTFKPLLIHADEGIVVLEENTVKSDLSEQVCIDVRSTLISSCNLFSTNPVPVPNLEPAVCISSKKKETCAGAKKLAQVLHHKIAGPRFGPTEVSN